MDEPEGADSCIICLEVLAGVPQDAHPVAAVGPESKPHLCTEQSNQPTTTDSQAIALIQPCRHFLHDECLKEWIQKANTCPICRQIFNLVQVQEGVGGPVVSEYAVEDKKQVAEFDPAAWVEEESEEEDDRPCPICGGADQPEILLLCSSCDAPYHTHCVGLDDVPADDWFCMECADEGAYQRGVAAFNSVASITGRFRPRTLESVRQTRRRIRNDGWAGTWSHISHRVHAAAGLDLDFSEDDQSMVSYREIQNRTANERRRFNAWQRRLNIASRQGAGNVFRAAAPPILQMRSQTPVETVEESMAWGDFEKAKEVDTTTTPRGRKRKSRSVTASPVDSPSIAGPSEEPKEPERKLKRPRTRKILDRPESSASPALPASRPSNGIMRHASPPPGPSNRDGEPSFLSSLLKEVEMVATSDDDRFGRSTMIAPVPNRVTSPSVDYSSPATSPSPSSYSTPRALSMTPPPHLKQRSISPLPLTSRIEPLFPPAEYSPNRSSPDASKPDRDHSKSPTTEIRQPRPRRRPVTLPRSEDTSPIRTPISPIRATMSIEAKESINKIVKAALSPHWKSAAITKEQYAEINRDVSRKLYEIIADRNLSDEKEKQRYEKVAVAEVATAVKSLLAA